MYTPWGYIKDGDNLDLADKINNKYRKLTCDSLSCGNNMDFAQLRPGETVLDLGCGSGRDSVVAAGLVGPKGRVIGLDLTPEMVHKARERALTEKVTNVEFVHGNIENLPFQQETIDVIISNCVINHSPDKLKVYQEIFRVLKLGGRFVISDAVSKEPLPGEVKNDPQAWADCYGGAVTEKEYIAIISVSGFNQIDILQKREYLKNGFDFASLTLLGLKNKEV